MRPPVGSPAITFDHVELQQVVQPTTDDMMEAMGINTHPGLARPQKEMMSRLLSEVGRIFHLPNPTLLPMLGEDGKPQTFRLNMKHDQAIRTRPYKTSPALQVELHKKIDELVKWGVLVESPHGGSFLSKYSSAVILVKKPTGDYRYVVDFRRVNAALHTPIIDLPSLDDILDECGARAGKPAAQVLSTFDIKESYHCMTIDERDRHILCCNAGGRFLAYTRAPMGLSPSSAWLIATLTRMFSHTYDGGGIMNGKPALHNFVAIFADDFLIHSANMEEHLLHIRWVFKQFFKYQVTLSLKKAVFAKKEVTFLAHRIHTEPVLSIKPLEERCLAIKDMPAPTDVTGVRRWLGVCSYYRRYIQDYSRIASPVTALLRDDVEFNWTQKCQESMDEFKKKLTSFPVNCVRDHSLPLIIRCDGSRTGIGAVLVQADRITPWMQKVLDKDNG